MAVNENEMKAGVSVSGEVLDTHITEQNAPNLILPDIEEAVLKMKPSSTPIDQILRHAKNRPCESMEFGYYAVDVRPSKSKVKTAYTKPTSNPPVRCTLDLADNTLFDESDTILFPDVKPEGSKMPLVALVVGKSSDGKLNVIALNGVQCKPGDVKKGLTLPSLAENTVAIRMGRAAGEVDVQSPSLESLPERETNFCQIFKMQVEESTILAAQKKEAKWTFNDLEENAIYEMRKGMEKSFLFGVKSKIYDDVKKQHVWTTGGIWGQCEKEFHYNHAAFTSSSFVDMCKMAFVGNNGSNRRICIGGSDFIAMISKLSVDKQQSSKETEVVWGIEWNKIVTNFGILDVLHDEVFDEVGMPGNAFVIDPEFLTKRILKPLAKLDLELEKSGQRATNARVLTEISGVILKYPESHLKVIRDEDSSTQTTPAVTPAT